MTALVTRRGALVLGLSGVATAALAADGPAPQLAALEQKAGGRLGVALLDTGAGRRFGHRQDERFPLCSTFKVLAAAAVLARVDRGQEQLDRRVVFTRDQVVSYSPVTGQHVGPPGMTLAELCEAALTRSDNTAGNMLLGAIGGPPGVTAFARGLGDRMTRLDRNETTLNEARHGDPRDTTTPAAMLANLHKLILGRALSPASRTQLTAWMVANTTGDARLRAGLPTGWRVADKTGAGDNGATNDIAVIWPPGRAPLIVCVYTMEGSGGAAEHSAVLAEVGRIVAANA
jgi:beta-lactamase class A